MEHQSFGTDFGDLLSTGYPSWPIRIEGSNESASSMQPPFGLSTSQLDVIFGTLQYS